MAATLPQPSAAPESAEPRIQDQAQLLEALKRLERIVVELYPGHVEPEPEHLGEYQAVWNAVTEARVAIAKAESEAEVERLSPKASEWMDQKLPPLPPDIVIYPYSPADDAGLQHMRRAYEQRCGELTAALATINRLTAVRQLKEGR